MSVLPLPASSLSLSLSPSLSLLSLFCLALSLAHDPIPVDFKAVALEFLWSLYISSHLPTASNFCPATLSWPCVSELGQTTPSPTPRRTTKPAIPAAHHPPLPATRYVYRNFVFSFSFLFAWRVSATVHAIPSLPLASNRPGQAGRVTRALLGGQEGTSRQAKAGARSKAEIGSSCQPCLTPFLPLPLLSLSLCPSLVPHPFTVFDP